MDKSSSLSIAADNLGVLRLIIMKERDFPMQDSPIQIHLFISKLMEFSRFYNEHYGNKTLEAGVADVTSAAVEAQVIISDFIHDMIRNQQKGFLNKEIFFLNDLEARRKNVNNKLEFINQVIDRVSKDACNSTTTISTTTTTTGGGDDILFVGREDDIQVIQERLISMNTNYGVISIVGMAGVGKTCLARQIYNSQQVRTNFDGLAWICARDHLPTVGLLKAIAEQMGYSSEDEIFPDHGFNNFLEEKRCLIVIDGIVAYEAWLHYLCAQLSWYGNIPHKILFTTRDTNPNAFYREHIPTSLHRRWFPFNSKYYIHRLGPLNDAESWEVFSKRVSLPLDLSSFKHEIIKKCHGLPQPILHLANKLSKEININRTDPHEGFQLLLHNIVDTHHHVLGRPLTSHRVDTIISELPPNLKHCLFYFRCFPKGSKIPSRRLIALWVAEGLVERRRRFNEPVVKPKVEPEVVAEGYLEQLIQCNMIEVVKYSSNQRPKKCRLANFLHAHSLFTTTLSGTQHLHQANSGSSSSSSGGTKEGFILRLADHAQNDEDIASPEHNKSLLLSFLSFDYREGPAPGERVGKFIYGAINKGCFRLLRVLDLERVYKPVLPKEIGRLIHLRYLGLRWTYLETLPSSILNLKNLQTLDIKHTYINTLPEPLWDLDSLRHLYLNEIQLAQSQCMPRYLRTLWGIFLSEEDHVDMFLLNPSVTQLGLVCHLPSDSDQEKMAKCILRQYRLQKLRLISKDQKNKPLNLRLKPFTNHKDLSDLYLFGKLLKVDEFPPNLNELTLSASNLVEDPMPTLGMLPKLTILRLYADTYIGKHMVCSSSSGFLKLQVLKIWKLKQLEEWVVEEGSMPVLEMLEIRACNSLSKLPDRFQKITTLVELKISDMPREFTAKVKQNKDKEWYKKAKVCFIDWEAGNSYMEAASSSSLSTFSSSPTFGSILLLFFLLGRLSASPTKHSTRVQGLPALGCVRL